MITRILHVVTNIRSAMSAFRVIKTDLSKKSHFLILSDYGMQTTIKRLEQG